MRQVRYRSKTAPFAAVAYRLPVVAICSSAPSRSVGSESTNHSRRSHREQLRMVTGAVGVESSISIIVRPQCEHAAMWLSLRHQPLLVVRCLSIATLRSEMREWAQHFALRVTNAGAAPLRVETEDGVRSLPTPAGSPC